MKKICTLLLLSSSLFSVAQQGAPASPYYNGFNWNQTGLNLKDALATKITSSHTRLLTYSEAENALKIVDVDPADGTNVFLVYGFSNNICSYTDEANYGTSNNSDEHRKRHREADQPSTPTVLEYVWNREHVYAASLGTPSLSTSVPGAGTDAHHVRAADIDRNNLRGNKKFTSGSGNSAVIGANFYPGDEWKGDVARVLMYLYLRYPSQCKPTGVGTGSVVASDPDMLQILLEWNADDPVSAYEDNRNTYLGNTNNTYGQGNRNPFVDNPYLATLIWGGPQADNRWPNLFVGTNEPADAAKVTIYPNPATGGQVYISSSTAWTEIKIVHINGQVAQVVQNNDVVPQTLNINDLAPGFYYVVFMNDNMSTTRKLIINE
jgi:endonuclease I